MIFEDCLAIILKNEGGYVNHPADPGGMTNLGVTRRVWEQWVGHPVTEAEMRALTPAKVGPLYRANYWNAVQGDRLPHAVALCVFDFAVNSGVGRSAKTLQPIVLEAPDGHVGPATINAVKGFCEMNGEGELVRQFSNARRSFYRGLKTFPTFGKGWLRRVDEVESAALRMI